MAKCYRARLENGSVYIGDLFIGIPTSEVPKDEELSDSLKVSDLVTLKEAGFTTEEIIELRKKEVL